jgi:prealbumin domain-containing protein
MSKGLRKIVPRARRRVLPVVVALLAGSFASFSPALASHQEVSLPGSDFEIDTDANLRVDDPVPSLDWANVTEVRKPDLASGSGDDSFGQGAKEDTAVPTVVDGSIPPNKSDLLNFGVYLEETAAGDRFLHVFWHRVQEPQGTTNMDFELNQSDSLSGNGVTPARTSGDLLIQYDLAQGGTNPQLFLARWIDGSEGATADDCEAANQLPCWSGRVNLSSAGDATGSINNSAIPAGESDGLGPVSARTFGEASVDFDVLVGDPTECVAFGSAYLKSRSSDSFTAALKDFIAPEAVDISLCGSVRVVKVDDATPPSPLDGAVFDLVGDDPPTAADGQTAPGPEDTVVVDTCTTAAGECTFADVFEGLYWVIEITAPPGHDLADPPYQAVVVTADETVEVTFVDPRQRGAILIGKTRKHAASGPGDVPHPGVEFSVSGAGLGAPVTVVTDANGQACVDGLLFGDYTVTETVPLGYVAAGPTSQSVTVSQKATCEEGPAAPVGFHNLPLTDLGVTVDSQVPGGTSSTIDCGVGGTGPGEDLALDLPDLPPGTYTCTIVIDP